MADPTDIIKERGNLQRSIIETAIGIRRALSLPEGMDASLEVRGHDRDLRDMQRLRAVDAFLKTTLESIRQRENIISENADLPIDLPGRNALLRAGYTSAQSVKALTEADLTAIDGIGATTAKRIRDFNVAENG